jgi:hypothetical protein
VVRIPSSICVIVWLLVLTVFWFFGCFQVWWDLQVHWYKFASTAPLQFYYPYKFVSTALSGRLEIVALFAIRSELMVYGQISILADGWFANFWTLIGARSRSLIIFMCDSLVWSIRPHLCWFIYVYHLFGLTCTFVWFYWVRLYVTLVYIFSVIFLCYIILWEYGRQWGSLDVPTYLVFLTILWCLLLH